MTDLLKQLEEAKNLVARLQVQVKQLSCREVGHDWKFLGGRNAGCCDDCNCSVSVHYCAKCDDCDYGDNAEAEEIRQKCLISRNYA